MERELLAYYSLMGNDIDLAPENRNSPEMPIVDDTAQRNVLERSVENDSDNQVEHSVLLSNEIVECEDSKALIPVVESNRRIDPLRGFMDSIIDSIAKSTVATSELIVESSATENTSPQPKSTLQQHIQNATELLSNVASEAFLFSVDRSKSFTDNYVTGMIFKDDPEYLHYQYFANSQYSPQSPDYWKLKCYLASLPWYQKQLIVETKAMTDLDSATGDPGPGAAPSGTRSGSDESQVAVRVQYPPQLLNEYEEVRRREVEADSASEGDGDGTEDGVGDRNIVPAGGGHSSDPGTILTHTNTGNNIANLLQSATNGDVLAQQQLHQLFSPPAFIKAPYCMRSSCHKMFSVACYRHHCRHCGLSFCSAHAARYHRIQKFGFASSTVRVCDACYAVIEAEEHRDKILWRMLRLKAYYQGSLIPYFEKRTDRGVDKVLR